jgi:hypothetical protein
VTEKTLDLKPPIIELGSFQVAGQKGLADLRPFFADKEISVGYETRPGVNRTRALVLDGSVPTVICLDTFTRESMIELYRVLGDGGVLVIW